MIYQENRRIRGLVICIDISGGSLFQEKQITECTKCTLNLVNTYMSVAWVQTNKQTVSPSINTVGTSEVKFNCSWDPGLNHFTVSVQWSDAECTRICMARDERWAKRKDWLFASDVPPAHLIKYKPLPLLYDFIQIVQLGKTGKEAEDNWQGSWGHARDAIWVSPKMSLQLVLKSIGCFQCTQFSGRKKVSKQVSKLLLRHSHK